ELSMKTFAQQQDKWRDYMASTVGEDKAKQFEEQVRKNIEETMKFFAPFVPAVPGQTPPQDVSSSSPPPSATAAAGNGAALPTGMDAIRAMQMQMMEMQRQLAQMATGTYTPSSEKPKDS
ncbi:MAG TPA: hypothetical protein VGO52_19825, partial [Hyphomonadaceae bacterium]|nr:hypothetical protein [Hyphomonadaceae bacterium]